MKLPSIVKLPKNRGFNYKPRYYDPVIEELQERVRKIKAEMGEDLENDEGAYKPRISFRRSIHEKGSQQGAVIRIALIVFMTLDVWIYISFGFSKMLQLILLAEILFGYLWFRFGKRFF